MPAEIFDYLPQNWLGVFAVLTFFTYIFAQIVEKYPIIARHVPFGKWWHGRQKKNGQRRAWVAEDNEVIAALQTQVTTIAKDLAVVNEKVGVFTAFTVYDARYHHRLEITHAGSGTCLIPKHFNFFEYERLWQKDPVAAATL